MQVHKANKRNASVHCNVSFTRSYNFCNGIEFVIVKVHGSIGTESSLDEKSVTRIGSCQGVNASMHLLRIYPSK